MSFKGDEVTVGPLREVIEIVDDSRSRSGRPTALRRIVFREIGVVEITSFDVKDLPVAYDGFSSLTLFKGNTDPGLAKREKRLFQATLPYHLPDIPEFTLSDPEQRQVRTLPITKDSPFQNA